MLSLRGNRSSYDQQSLYPTGAGVASKKDVFTSVRFTVLVKLFNRLVWKTPLRLQAHNLNALFVSRRLWKLKAGRRFLFPERVWQTELQFAEQSSEVASPPRLLPASTGLDQLACSRRKFTHTAPRGKSTIQGSLPYSQLPPPTRPSSWPCQSALSGGRNVWLFQSRAGGLMPSMPINGCKRGPL